MKNKKTKELEFIVDRLTNSILNVVSGDSFQTEVIQLTKSDLNNLTEKNGWNFDWDLEFDDIKKRFIN